MSTLNEKLWRRGPTDEILKEAREQFEATFEEGNEGAAHSALGSVHYSLVKNYWRGVFPRLVAAYHFWRAAHHARMAFGCGLGKLNFDQIEVMTRILGTAPRLLGGDAVLAENIIHSVMASKDAQTMVPHTRLFFLMTLADCKLKRGIKSEEEEEEVTRLYYAVFDLQDQILSEPDILQAKRQLCRAKKQAGVFFFDHFVDEMNRWGEELLHEALALSHETKTESQEEQILQLLKERGILSGSSES